MKLILSETQFNKLINLINEGNFDAVIKNNIKPGDIIKIIFKDGTDNNFKVIDSITGQITMDNIDKGSANINYRYWFSYTDISYNTLFLKRVHKIKEKDLLNEKPTSWKSIALKNINNIEIYDKNGNKKDDIKLKEKEIAKEFNNNKLPSNLQDQLKDIISEVIKLNDDYTISFDLTNGDNIIFCAVSKVALTYELEVADSSANLDKYDFLMDNRVIMEFYGGVEESFEKNVITTSDGKTFSLLLKLMRGETAIDYYLDFNKVLLGNKCSDIEKEKQEKEDKEKQEKSKSKEEKRVLDAKEKKELINYILNNPDVKKAFYKAPSLWNSFISGITGKDAKGTGIGPGLNIISRFDLGKHKKEVGEDAIKFKTGNKVSFEILGNPIIFKNNKQLNIGEDYIGYISEFKYGNKYLSLKINDPFDGKIFIKKEINDDIYDVTIKESYKSGEIKTARIKIIDYNIKK